MKQILSDKYRCIVLFVKIFIVILLLPFLYNYISVDKDASTTFYLPSSNLNDIVHVLENNNYTLTAIDRWMLELIDAPQEGWYHVDHNKYGRFLFFATLHSKNAATMDIVLYAGETQEELLTRLTNDMKLNKKKLQQAYKNFIRFEEADLLAQRYTIARKANEQTTIQYLFDTSNLKLLKFEKKYFSQKPDTVTLKTLLTIASIIQKESNSVEEMPTISSVIHNRLDKDMKLQMDSTLNYGKYSHVIVTPERIRNDKSYFNTYKHKGLPPHPLSTVTLNALKAAISPQKSDYLFFYAQAKWKNIPFAATYDKHLENIRIFREYQKKRKQEKAENQADKKKSKKKAKKAKK